MLAILLALATLLDDPLASSQSSGATCNDIEMAFGSALATMGDVDGDGVGDFACSAPNGSIPKVWVLSGKDGRAIRAWSGEQGEKFGIALARAHDADGDGRDDLWISVPSQVTGKVRLYSTGPDARRLMTLTSDAIGFGGVMRSDGDVDGDGVADLAVGASIGTGEHYPGGSVTIVSGATRKVLRTFTGDPDCVCGLSFDISRDVDRDGKSDVLVVSVGERCENWNARGSVTIYSGADGSKLRTVSGASELNGFVRAASFVDDQDRDGTPDIAVMTLASCHESAGLRVISGASGKAIVCAPAPQGDPWKRQGPFRSTAYAFRMLAVGDYDGDGVGELVLGEPGAFWGLLGTCGLVSVVSPSRNTCLTFQAPPNAPRELGYALCRAGDFDADGVIDFVASAPDFAFYPGVVCAYSGREPLKLLRIIDPEDVEK